MPTKFQRRIGGSKYSMSKRMPLVKGRKRRARSMIKIARSMDLRHAPYPPSKYCKLVYFDTFVKTQTTGITTPQQFRLNSLYDFDWTGGGHQPYYYDQMTPLYGSYKVYGVKIKYQYTCDSGSGASYESQIVIRPTADGTTPTGSGLGFTVESERPGALVKVFSAGGQPIVGSIFYSPRKILGLSKDQYNDEDNTGAAVTTNPTTVAYLNFMGLSTVSDSIHILRIKATFYCKFYNRKIVSQS